MTRLTELTPEIVHEFIDKIVVSKPERFFETSIIKACDTVRKNCITGGFVAYAISRLRRQSEIIYSQLPEVE